MSRFPSALVLDFDGVIADTERLHLRAFRRALRDRDIHIRDEDYFARYLGLDDRDVLRSAARDAGARLDAGQIETVLKEKSAFYAEAIATAPVIYDGVEQRLREWSARLPLAIASGSLRSEIEAILGRHRLLDCFAAIVAADDVAQGKPAPDGYLLALHRLNVGKAASPRGSGSGRRQEPIHPRDCIAIEDSLPGLQAARAAGMRTVAVTTNHPAARLASADLVVASLTALDLQTLGKLI